MGNKKGNYYFETFIELADYSCSAASMLHETLLNFNANTLEEKIGKMHEIEHTADIKKHHMTNKLIKEFITPIERGDIIELSHEIDNVTDAIEDILIKIYMFNITYMPKEALDFSDIILKSCKELKDLMKEFQNFKKSQNIHKLIVNINDLEEQGDRLYTMSIRKLFTTSKDPIVLMTWQDTFEYFEKCCDACENAANVVESVIMQNS